MIGTDKNNFPHNLLLTNRKIVDLRRVFANSSSKDIKLSKTYLSKIIQSGGFLGRLVGSLMKLWLPLVKNILTPLAKGVQVGLPATALAADAGIHKKVLRFGASGS